MAPKKAAVVIDAIDIGYQIVRNLCEQFNGDVFFTNNDLEESERALKKLRHDSNNPKFFKLDITDKKDVQQFGNFIHSEYGGLDILVLNEVSKVTDESAEKVISANFNAKQQLLDLLVPLIRPGGRVVILCDSGFLYHVPGHDHKVQLSAFDLNRHKLNWLVSQYLMDVKNNVSIKKGWPMSAYSMSKVFMTAFTKVLQNELDRVNDILVNCVYLTGSAIRSDKSGDCPTMLALYPTGQNDAPKGQVFNIDGQMVDWTYESNCFSRG